jgi:hypothetical protein
MSQENLLEPDPVAGELLRGQGYHLLTNLISESQALAIRARVLGRLDDAKLFGKGIYGLSNLITWGNEFQAMVTHPGLLNVAKTLLGSDVKLAALSARVLSPDCEMGPIHVDYPYWAMNPGMPVDPALMLQVIWMMEPFTENNGGTLVAPGSQSWDGRPQQDKFDSCAIQITGNAGDAVVSHGLLWHCTALNQSDTPRVAILINFTQLTVKPMHCLGPFDETFKTLASPELRSLLGFHWGDDLSNRAPRRD